MATTVAAKEGTATDQVQALLAELQAQRAQTEALEARLGAMEARGGAALSESQQKVIGAILGSAHTREQVEAFLAKGFPKTVFFSDPAGAKLTAIHDRKNFDPTTGNSERVQGVQISFGPYHQEGAELVDPSDPRGVRPAILWGICDIAALSNVVPDDQEPVLGEYTQAKVIGEIERSSLYRDGIVFSGARAVELLWAHYEEAWANQRKRDAYSDMANGAAPGQTKMGRL